ncbi:MAG TPA: 30S ribosomal protein S16 [Fibrobacteraceae bacterium]|nr:30S ribosomal protein S16 [Fibrobacteraceae bacterium]
MSTVIRLSRYGKRHVPIYRVIVVDNRKARDGQFIEQVGFFNPNLAKPEIRFEQDKIMKWLSLGAQPSDTVRSLLKKVGIMDLFHHQRAGRSLEGKTATPRVGKVKSKRLSLKAKAKAEAEKKAQETPAEESAG